MGDRANVKIKSESEPGVYLYTHWGGSELPKILASALARGRGRWSDSPYLSRIIFCEMIGDDVKGLTGLGISSRLTDNEYPVLVVDTDTETVTTEEHRRASDKKWTFEEFTKVRSWEDVLEPKEQMCDGSCSKLPKDKLP